MPHGVEVNPQGDSHLSHCGHLLTRADDAAKLPETFGGLDVIVEIVGAVRAL